MSDPIVDLMTAWDNMDKAAQRMLTSLPHQITEAAERLEASRLATRNAVQQMSRYVADLETQTSEPNENSGGIKP